MTEEVDPTISVLNNLPTAFREWMTEQSANAPRPPVSVLLRRLTPADIKAYPVYFILGPGYDIASKTLCGHGYHLTDSCPGCDADEDGI